MSCSDRLVTAVLPCMTQLIVDSRQVRCLMTEMIISVTNIVALALS